MDFEFLVITENRDWGKVMRIILRPFGRVYFLSVAALASWAGAYRPDAVIVLPDGCGASFSELACRTRHILIPAVPFNVAGLVQRLLPKHRQ